MDAHNSRTDAPWSSIPTELLLAELQRRDDANERPACGSKSRGSYDTGIHVFALFLILFLSTLGMSHASAPFIFLLTSFRANRDSKQPADSLSSPSA